MNDFDDIPYDLTDVIPRYFPSKEVRTMHITDEHIKSNKYYVGANSVFVRNWGHKTLNEASVHASELLDSDGREEVFIVKIVRVIRKKKIKPPVEIYDVK